MNTLGAMYVAEADHQNTNFCHMGQQVSSFLSIQKDHQLGANGLRWIKGLSSAGEHLESLYSRYRGICQPFRAYCFCKLHVLFSRLVNAPRNAMTSFKIPTRSGILHAGRIVTITSITARAVEGVLSCGKRVGYLRVSLEDAGVKLPEVVA